MKSIWIALCTIIIIPAAWASCDTCPESTYEAAVLGGVSIWTNVYEYDPNSIITIHGYAHNTQHDITLMALSPDGNVAAVRQVNPDTDGMFYTTISTSGPYWKTQGMYTITARAGPDSQPYTVRVLVGQCGDNMIRVETTMHGDHCMAAHTTNSARIQHASIKDNSLTLDVQGFGPSTLTLEMPRYLLDARYDNTIIPYTITSNDDRIVPFRETYSDDTTRIISVEYPPAEYGTLIISGTHTVPEFGLAIIVLAASLCVLAARRNIV